MNEMRNYLLQTSHLWIPTSLARRAFCTSFRFRYRTVLSSTHTSTVALTCCQSNHNFKNLLVEMIKLEEKTKESKGRRSSVNTKGMGGAGLLGD